MGVLKKLDQTIQKHLKHKDLVKIVRVIDGVDMGGTGFILDASKEFILVQKEDEFLLDGYLLFQKKQIEDIRCNTFDKVSKKILKSEGVLDREYGIKNNINLLSFQTIFTDIKKEFGCAIVECEQGDDPVFVIGPIKRVNKDSLSIQHFDAKGMLEKKVTKVPFSDITLVTFGDRYTSTFKKYIH